MKFEGIPNLMKLSRNWKFFFVWSVVSLVSSQIEYLNPVDQSTSIFTLVLSLIFVFFIFHLVAQRGVRVGYRYWPTFVFAWINLPITAFVLWVVKKPIDTQY